MHGSIPAPPTKVLMDVLYLSHCVPNPPDKGEKIRAFHELSHLAKRFRVHLACFARSGQDMDSAHRLEDRCASVYTERIPRTGLAKAAVRFAAGASLTESFYGSSRMRAYLRSLCERVRISACVSFSSAMVPYVPETLPLVIDMVDVDSEKWFQYARMRTPGFPYLVEGRRLRALEIKFAARARRTYVTTAAEEELLRSFAGEAATGYFENGVHAGYFDPLRVPTLPELGGRHYAVFVGGMDYYPNRDAVIWFARQVMPRLRQSRPDFEFWIVGRNPSAGVRKLGGEDGVTVTGNVSDVRPYLKDAELFVAPLRIARGIQNKILEALAMGKQVFASSAVCRTFGRQLPLGVSNGDTPEDYLAGCCREHTATKFDPEIRQEACRRFSWERNLAVFASEVESAAASDEGSLHSSPGV